MLGPIALKLAPYVAVAVVAGAAGWTVNGWRLGAKIEALQASYAKAQAEAYQRTREAEGRLSEQAERARKEKDREIKTIRDQYERTIVGLRDRPDRGAAVPEAAAACAGVSGKELARGDAGFLAGYAADAARLQSAVNQCEAAYDAARRSMN